MNDLHLEVLMWRWRYQSNPGACIRKMRICTHYPIGCKIFIIWQIVHLLSLAFADTNSVSTELEPVWINGLKLNIQEVQSQPSFDPKSTTQHYLVQFRHALSPRERREMRRSGIQFLNYIPAYAYFITGPIEILQLLEKQENVVALVLIPPETKMEASLREYLNNQVESGRFFPFQNHRLNVQLSFFRGTSFPSACEILSSHGIVLAASQTAFDFRESLDCVSVPTRNVRDLAEEDSVFMIGGIDPPAQPLNRNAQWTSRIDEIHPGGLSDYNLDGAGVTVGLVDVGAVRTTHEQLRGRAFQMDGYEYCSGHSSGVAGTIAGSGEGNAMAQGMAPQATLLCWQQLHDLAEIDENAHRIVVSNHSYGAAAGKESSAGQIQWQGDDLPSIAAHTYGVYSMKSQSWDRIAYDHDHLMVTAAGNNREMPLSTSGASYVIPKEKSGSAMQRSMPQSTSEEYHTLTPLGGTKNGISIGAIHALTTQAQEIDESFMTSFSSWGPTDDGRIKPDLVADGVRLLTVNNVSDVSYQSLGGTSMSSAVVTGAVACLTQLFRIQYHGADPAAPLMKGLLLHTARHAGSGSGPNYRFGWGLLDASAAADFIVSNGNNDQWMDMDSIAETNVEYLCSSSGLGSIKATLVWTDWPGLPTSGVQQYHIPNLINDLDLSIIGPDGKHYPWTLDPEHPAEPARQDRVNRRDNVEQICIETPIAGTYIIRIGGQVNMGDEQIYTICVSGLRRLECLPYLWILNPCGTKTVAGDTLIEVVSMGLTGQARLQINVDGKPWDDPSTFILEGDQEISPLEGTYHGTIPWNTGCLPNGDHNLEVIVTDTGGRVCRKQITIWVFNDDSALSVNGPRVIGFLSEPGQSDRYVLQVSDTAIYTIETHPVGNHPEVDTVLILDATDDDGGYEKYSKITQVLEVGRVYHITVLGYKNSTGYYHIDIKQAKYAANTPTYIPLALDGSPFRNTILDCGDTHWYALRPEQTELVVVCARPGDPAPQNLELALYNASEPNEVLSSGTFQADMEVILVKNCLYYLSASSHKSKGSYTIQVNRVNESANKRLLVVDDPPLTATFTPQTLYRFMPLENGTYVFTIQPSSRHGYANYHACLNGEKDFINIHRWLDTTLNTEIQNPIKTTLFAVLKGWQVYDVLFESTRMEGTYTIQVRRAHPAELPIKAIRYFPSSGYQPGIPMDVTVHVEVQAQHGLEPFSATLYESGPNDWLPADSIVDSIPPFSLRFPLRGDVSQSVSYQLFPPDSATDPQILDGKIYFYTSEGLNTVAVAGDSIIQPLLITGVEGWQEY